MTHKKQSLPTCAVCEMREGVLANALLLGCTGWLCRVCFELWYCEGLTNRQAIRQQSLTLLQQSPEWLRQRAMDAAFARE